MDFYSMFDDFEAQHDSNTQHLSGAWSEHGNNNTQNNSNMKFDLPQHNSIIKVIGVGGGGSNAVNHMYRQGINGVDFIVCNTDKQALDISPIPMKIVLGATLTEGRGAGSIPEVGRNAAIETIEELRGVLANNTKMLFITAGMGGGTGTGAAPIIAGIARELGILTVAIVTVPFSFEGKKRKAQAEEGIEQLKQCVDTLLVICNDKLREIHGNLKLSEAFEHADNVLTGAARSIADIISLTQQINVDFADVCTVMRQSGVAIMGSAMTSGENRAVRATELALNSPLLNDNNIQGARYVLLNIVSGAEEITMDELGEITDYIQEAAGQTAEIIKGYGVNEDLGDNVSVTIIATGFNSSSPVSYEYSKNVQPAKVVRSLDEPKTESYIETVKPEEKTHNVLEPFLVSKTDPIAIGSVAEVKNEAAEVPVVSEVKPQNELEPFLLVRNEAEVVAETKVEEVVTPVNEIVPFIPAQEVEVPAAEETELPVQTTTEEVKDEVVFQQAAEIEFEVTNTVTAETEVAEFVSESENEIVSENESWETENSSNEIISSVEENNEIVASVEQPVMEHISEPVAEVTSNPVAELELNLASEAEAKAAAAAEEEERVKKMQQEEQMRKAQERIMKLKELSMKLKTPNGLSELENEPAYKRRNVSLDNEQHSSESSVSRFTLSENDEKKIEIRPNNSFLHDNVD